MLHAIPPPAPHREHAFETSSRAPHAVEIFRRRRAPWRPFWFCVGVACGAFAQILWGLLP